MDTFQHPHTSCRDFSKNSNSLLIAKWPHPYMHYESAPGYLQQKNKQWYNIHGQFHDLIHRLSSDIEPTISQALLLYCSSHTL